MKLLKDASKIRIFLMMGYFLEWKIITCFISKYKIYDYLHNKCFRLATIIF